MAQILQIINYILFYINYKSVRTRITDPRHTVMFSKTLSVDLSYFQ